MNIIPFTSENFARALVNDYTPLDAVKSKKQFDYFEKYIGIGGLNATFMVVEEKYISKDYLHDYAAYYSLCFEGYSKYCKRIHFFRITLTDEIFDKVILGKLESPLDIWEYYLGFIVAKPIPSTVFGYSVLENYNIKNDLADRQFWGLREYTIHLFGHERKMCSLAFQEQDKVLSACATTAIWSMLNKAAVDIHTVLKSPNQITRDAGTLSEDGSRLFPNKGLSIKQICKAIQRSGLETELWQPDTVLPNVLGIADGNYITNAYTRKIINAYSGLKIPIILVIEVPNEDELGMHAVAVSGCRQLPLYGRPQADEAGWRADDIECIYAHDDQIGPFVRIRYLDHCDIETPWTERRDDKLPTRVTNIVVAVYPKVRIAFDEIELVVDTFDTVLTGFFADKIRHDLVWDIKLQFSEDVKKDILNSSLGDSQKLALVKECMPKYLWVATCYTGELKILVFTFDATDVNYAMTARHLICLLPDNFRSGLAAFLRDRREILYDLFLEDGPNPQYFDFLVNKFA